MSMNTHHLGMAHAISLVSINTHPLGMAHAISQVSVNTHPLGMAHAISQVSVNTHHLGMAHAISQVSLNTHHLGMAHAISQVSVNTHHLGMAHAISQVSVNTHHLSIPCNTGGIFFSFDKAYTERKNKYTIKIKKLYLTSHIRNRQHKLSRPFIVTNKVSINKYLPASIYTSNTKYLLFDC